MWQEADALFEEFPQDIHDRPHLLAFYIMLGAAVEVVTGKSRKTEAAPALTPVQQLRRDLVAAL